MTIDIDALLGGEAAPPVRRRRRVPPTPPSVVEIDLETVDLSDLPDGNAIVRQNAIKLAGSGRAFIENGELRRPVSKNFLALLFDMDPATVTKRLLDCPVAGRAGGDRPMYDFRTALGYLIPPKMDISAYIESLDPNELPNHISQAYWNSRRTRLKFMLEAGEAWATGDVVDVLGDVWQLLKSWSQLLPDTLRDRCNLTDEQFSAMTEAVDAMQIELHKRLCEAPARRQTLSLAQEFDGGGDVG